MSNHADLIDRRGSSTSSPQRKQGTTMTLPLSSPLLRKVLFADAAISGATGLLMVAGAHFLGALVEVPTPLLNYAGLSLLPGLCWLPISPRGRLGRQSYGRSYSATCSGRQIVLSSC